MGSIPPLLDVSTCEHGKELRSFKSVQEGMEFSDKACTDSKGFPKWHLATQDKYAPLPPTKADGRIGVGGKRL